MEGRRREYLVARICAGYLRFKISSDICLIIKPLTLEQKYIAQEIYNEAYEKAFEENLLTDEEILDMMRKNGFWANIDDRRLEQIPKDIENKKVDLFESYFSSETREAIRGFLRKAEAQLIKTMGKRHVYDSSTCDGYASYYRWNWMIENSTYYENGDKYDWSQASLSDVLSYYQENMLTETECRELSRTEPWRSIWNSGKKTGGLFGKSSVDFTAEQNMLITWSSMYDSIAESGECPSDEVIEDDDALDGWLILQRRKREAQMGKSSAEKVIGNEKIANAGEVFIMTGNKQEDMDRVAALNDPHVQAAKKSRFKALKDGGKPIEVQNLPDVRQDIKMESHNKMRDTLRGG